MILLTSFWLISQAFLSNCNPTDPFILKGTVVPAGNYQIYVRTVSSAYLSAILRSYDKEISNVKAAVNNARMWHSDLPNLVKQRFDAETSFALLGQSEIVKDSKFEIQLDWTKVHNAYFDREKHPIYVQIYTKNNSAETSLMERILIDPSILFEYKFLYGEPRNQSGGEQKLLLGHVPISSEKAENYKVKIHKDTNPLINPINDLLADTDADGNFVLKFGNNIQLPENFYLSFYDSVRLEKSPIKNTKIFKFEKQSHLLCKIEIDFLTGVYSTELAKEIDELEEFKTYKRFLIDVIIRNVPKFDERQVTKIEFAHDKKPLEIIEPYKGSNQSKTEVIFKTRIAFYSTSFNLMVTPIEFEPAEKYPSFQHKLTYPTLASAPICSENMKSLIQFEESDGEEALCWRYNFEKGLKNDGIGMGEEKAKMINLYKTYLEERGDITNAEHIPAISSKAEGRHVNVDAYALSLQMVDMKKIGNN